MKIYVYDFEVFACDWIGIFKDKDTGEYTIIHNDPRGLRNFINSDSVYVGFNSKNYDQFIVKAICNHEEIFPEIVKELNDFIIAEGRNGWEHPYIKENWYTFNNIDIRDDCQFGLSLKAIEGHLGMSIEESSVPFDIDHSLTQAEYDEVVKYCKHDVDTTERLLDIRKEYLKNKIAVGRMVGLPDAKSLSMTNAKLTAALLKASPKTYTDERDYQYPPNLCKEFIPQEVFDFFDKMHDPSILDEELFKSKLDLDVGGCPAVIAYGGIHSALPAYQEEAQGSRTIRNYDVASLYPSIMIQCGYTSRSIPSAASFEEIYRTRLAAKKSGDKATANALKLVLNTTYGAMLNQFNDLHDPRMGRSVCVSGQLFILELAERYVHDLKTVRIIQLNTDGLMVSLEESELPALYAINEEWQKRTRFTLEEDVIKKVIQKDVNNYVEIQADGKVKKKGGYLVRGIAPAGAFNINNNATIVAKAITDYFVDGIPVEDTINTCDDIMAFQQIAKAGAKYKEAYHIVDGEKIPIQKVNRVYASKDERYGKLYKVKTENDSTAKIEMLPEHCIIDNDNRLTIDDIDKTFYIEMAKKRINDFMGIKPEKKGRKNMATTPAKLNIYQRLSNVREKFLANGIKKTGKNPSLRATYFELDEIVPISAPLFKEENLFPAMNFTKDECTMTIIDMLDDSKSITFAAPVREWLGNAAVTPVQAMGATITYMRRYLYQIALDIVECDGMENGSLPINVDEKKEKPAEKPSAPKIPLTPETREAVATELAAPDGNATDLQISMLKKKLKELRGEGKNKEVDTWVASLALETKSFTKLTKTRCEEILTEIARRLENNAQ